MCGIFALLSTKYGSKYSKEALYKGFMSIKGRGPDASMIVNVTPNLFYGFHRLSIMDTSMSGMQPFVHSVTSSTTTSNENTTDNTQSTKLQRKYATVDKEYTDEKYGTPMLEATEFTAEDDDIIVQCNGEIYNSFDLQKEYNLEFSSSSDCEVIPLLYHYFDGDIEKVCHSLDGVFAFTLYDKKKDILFAGRDPIGVRPLFIGWDEKNESTIFASEGKAIIPFTSNVKQFQPGSYWRSDDATTDDNKFKFRKWFNLIESEPTDVDIHTATHFNSSDESEKTEKLNYITEEEDALCMIRENLVTATKKRLMADRPIGCFLSGGLDSSLITAMVSRYNPYTVNTYAIGMSGATDLYNAEIAAEHMKTNHFGIEFTSDEGIDAVEKVIHCLETYDITTIRASVGMYLLSKHITENTDDIVIYSGEGSDEVTQGYLYFHNSPCPDSGNLESQRLINDLHYFDVKRVDRTVSSQGLEVRVPFLDKTFIKNYMKICPALRRPHYKNCEKYLVRKAFDNDVINRQCNKLEKEELYDLLPSSILWRTKEAFSDGVSSVKKSWHLLLQDFIDQNISDDEYNNARQNYKDNGLMVPISKESYYYRKLYEKHFGDQLELIPYYWMPQWSNATDPSARTIGKYKELIDEE